MSFAENIPQILHVVNVVNPRIVLDVGAGFGKYGLLIREQYLSRKTERGDLSPTDDMHISAIEDNGYFLKPDRLWTIYNNVFIKPLGNEFHSSFRMHYDLVLLIDVIEHWTEMEASIRIKALLEHTDNILISTPKEVTMYKDHFYGDNRHHITQFNKDFLPSIGITYLDYSNHLSWIWLIKKGKPIMTDVEGRNFESN